MPESFFPEEHIDAEQHPVSDLVEPVPQTPQSTDSADHLESEDSRLGALIAYIPFLCFIPLLNMRENKDALFHARQGTILFLIELGAAVLLVDGISDFFFKAVLVAAVVLSAAGIYSALQGKNFRLPIISDLADKTKL
jgi:fumarate reductase subunit D